MTTEKVPLNRDIEQFLATVHQLEIEEQWGFAQLAEYLSEIDARRAGVDFKDLGIANRRHAALPGLIALNSDGQVRLISDAGVLFKQEETPAGSFAHLRLQGVMRSQDGLSTRGVNSLVNDIYAAFSNDNIEGVLLEVNTGGGESLAGTILQSALADAPKPVVVYAHFLASAGVRGTLPATEIIASGEGAQVGSIGTFITLQKGFAEAYNEWYEDIYAKDSTNKNRDFREYVKGNKQPLQDSIDRSNRIFLNEVRQYRDLKRDAEHTLSGAMFFAREAKSRGLVDAIGSLQYATQRLATHARRKKSM